MRQNDAVTASPTEPVPEQVVGLGWPGVAGSEPNVDVSRETVLAAHEVGAHEVGLGWPEGPQPERAT